MNHGVRGGRNSFLVKEQKNTHTHTAATSGVLGEDDLQSIFKFFAMATGSMIRGK